jgi:large subunit ribosomal protein L33
MLVAAVNPEGAWRALVLDDCLSSTSGRDRPMAKKKGDRIVIKLRSTESGHVYWTEKNRRNDQGRLELKKFDPVLRKVAVYREQR